MGITLKVMVWIRSRIFRAPKPKHIKEGHPNIGHVLNKRRRKHFKEGPYTKPSATLLRTEKPQISEEYVELCHDYMLLKAAREDPPNEE